MKLNLASHGEHIPGYVSVDFDHPTAEVRADVTELPFENDSADEILAFHILEHFRAGDYEPHLSNPLNPKTAKQALLEWKRVLKPGGLLQIKVPDFEKIVWLYYNFPQWARAESPVNPPFGNFSDWICSNGQHQCLFDRNSMTVLLQSVGFKDIRFLDVNPPKTSIGRENLEMYIACKK